MTLETPTDSASQSRGKRESKITTHGLCGRNILQGDRKLDSLKNNSIKTPVTAKTCVVNEKQGNINITTIYKIVAHMQLVLHGHINVQLIGILLTGLNK